MFVTDIDERFTTETVPVPVQVPAELSAPWLVTSASPRSGSIATAIGFSPIGMAPITAKLFSFEAEPPGVITSKEKRRGAASRFPGIVAVACRPFGLTTVGTIVPSSLTANRTQIQIRSR